MEDTLITIVGSIIGFGLVLGLSLGLVQALGIDREKMQHKTGKLSIATKKQVKYALIIAIAVVIAIFLIMKFSWWG